MVGDLLVLVRIPLVSASVSALAPARKILVPTKSLEPDDGIPPNMPGCIIGISIRADKVLVSLTLYSRSQEDLGDKFLYP